MEAEGNTEAGLKTKSIAHIKPMYSKRATISSLYRNRTEKKNKIKTVGMQKNKKTKPLKGQQSSNEKELNHIIVLGFANNSTSVSTKATAISKKNA
ncbi:MAG: hypothetical protein JXR27_03865 [Paludibacteraceae bacterium]|nr:hypothetical protein [Paludibacteraceae bacterium]